VTVRIVIPVKAPERGKARLAEALSASARAALNLRFFDHVLGLALRVAPGRCHVVSRSPDMLARAATAGAHAIVEWGEGLNPALEQAARQLGGEAPILTLSTDLPLLEESDLAALIAASRRWPVVAASDLAGAGTNALVLGRPGLISYRYGAASLAAHRREAEQAGLSFHSLFARGLATDIDTPADLSALRAA
jgi:2-phospho-L-lactate guanylyltransferase